MVSSEVKWKVYINERVNNLKDLFFSFWWLAQHILSKSELFSGYSEDFKNLHSIDISLKWAVGFFHTFIFIFLYFFIFCTFFCFVSFLKKITKALLDGVLNRLMHYFILCSFVLIYFPIARSFQYEHLRLSIRNW